MHTVRLLTEGDDTRGCGDTIGPPDDEQRAARNMLRSVVYAYCTAAYRGDDTRGCGDTIGPPDDEQRAARNMLRNVV